MPVEPFIWPATALLMFLALIYGACRTLDTMDRRRCERASGRQEVDLETTRLDQEERRQALSQATQTMASRVALQIAQLNLQIAEAEASARVTTETLEERIKAHMRVLWAHTEAEIATAPEKARQEALRLPIEALQRLYEIYLEALRKYGKDTGDYPRPVTFDEFIGWLEFTPEGGIVPIAEPKSPPPAQAATTERSTEHAVVASTAT